MAEPHLELALVHYPVLNRQGARIASALTNLDLHDIARAAKTFGVARYWVVTPLAGQRSMAEEIVAHWHSGHGAQANPDRGEALSLVRLCATVQEAAAAMRAECADTRTSVLATCAQGGRTTLSYGETRARLWQGEAFLVLFGTGWGLAPDILDAVDAVLPPILGPGPYNHLSVRSAAAIVLDRLMGGREKDMTVANTTCTQ